jgi:hypothetical protein
MIPMKKLAFLFLALLLSSPLLPAQDCYTKARTKGISAYNKKNYEAAKDYFLFAQNCDDKPANNDLQSWINRCTAKEAEARRRQEAKQQNPRPKAEPQRPTEPQRKLPPIKLPEPPANPPSYTPPPITLIVSNNNLIFNASGSQELSIQVTTNAPNWTVSKDLPWCRITQSPNALRLICRPNTDDLPRSDFFYILANDQRERIDIRQDVAQDPVALGNQFYEGKKYEEARKLYVMGVVRGIPEAQYRLGKMYLEGLGVEKDRTRAMELFMNSADAKYAPAENAIGYMCETQAVPNYKEAVRWYKISAENGYAVAQYNLGLMYQFGLGVKKNQKEAKKWFQKSADQGLPEAKEKIEQQN